MKSRTSNNLDGLSTWLYRDAPDIFAFETDNDRKLRHEYYNAKFLDFLFFPTIVLLGYFGSKLSFFASLMGVNVGVILYVLFWYPRLVKLIENYPNDFILSPKGFKQYQLSKTGFFIQVFLLFVISNFVAILLHTSFVQ